jgi:hypothetical protein
MTMATGACALILIAVAFVVYRVIRRRRKGAPGIQR